MQRDLIYSKESDLVESFRFDEAVAAVFSDMIQRSVPGYGTVISLVGLLAEQYLREDSRGYDLGSSLGASLMAMARGSEDRNCRLVAVDSSAAMIERCRDYLRQAGLDQRVNLQCGDIRNLELSQATLVTINYTLQFLPLEDRYALLQRVAQGTLPGGALMLSEKIRFADPEQQQRMDRLHDGFKRANGYSELEISRKRSALEAVLRSETLEDHLRRLKAVGYSQIEVIFQALNFVTILAIR